MQIYFHSRLCSYLSRVPILVEGTVNNNDTRSEDPTTTLYKQLHLSLKVYLDKNA